jgi:hypothetical protein
LDDTGLRPEQFNLDGLNPWSHIVFQPRRGDALPFAVLGGEWSRVTAEPDSPRSLACHRTPGGPPSCNQLHELPHGFEFHGPLVDVNPNSSASANCSLRSGVAQVHRQREHCNLLPRTGQHRQKMRRGIAGSGSSWKNSATLSTANYQQPSTDSVGVAASSEVLSPVSSLNTHRTTTRSSAECRETSIFRKRIVEIRTGA